MMRGSEYEKNVFNSLSLLARGIVELDTAYKEERLEQFPKILVQASGELHKIGLQINLDNKHLYPLTLDEQITWWETPLDQWPYPEFSRWFSISEEDFEENLLYDYELTDFCFSIAQTGRDPLYEQDTIAFLEIRDSLQNDSKLYANVRTFLIENPVLDVSRPTFLKALRHLPEKVQEKLLNELYEDIPKHYFRKGQVQLCPHCGWTLSFSKDNEANCDTEKCKKISGNWNDNKRTISSSKLRRVRRGIRRYIVAPGLLELKLFQKLNQLDGHTSVILYPNMDQFDIEITFKDRSSWVVDVKDWSNPYVLNHHLKPFVKDESRVEGFVVVPAYRGEAFLKILQNICDKGYKVMNEKQFINYVKGKLAYED